MKSIFKLKIIIFVIFLCSSPFAQNTKPRFLELSLDKGVSLNLTYDMLQDSKGFLWFGTMYGLVKYDGENYEGLALVNKGDNKKTLYIDYWLYSSVYTTPLRCCNRGKPSLGFS